MSRKHLLPALLVGLSACRTAGRVDAANNPPQLSDAELKERIERLFVADSDPRRDNFDILRKAGRRTIPFLVKALDDPRTESLRFPKGPHDIFEESPLRRICGLLTFTPAAEAAKPLAKYVEHPNPAFRGEAASTLGRIAAPDCIEPVKKALADRDQEVRQFALIGIDAGIRENGRHQEFLNGIYDAVAAMMTSGEHYNLSGPASVLAMIDGPKAAPLLESRRYFTTRNPQLRDVLVGLNFEGHKTPHAILMPLMKELAPAAARDGRRGLEFAAALQLYARNPDPEAEATFRALSESGTDSVAVGAGKALEILAGVDTARVMKLGHDGNFATMTPPQRYYFAVSEYHFEVCNGGHDQFFYNSAGDLYPTVLEGLHAIGAHTQAATLQEAMNAFGARIETNWEARRRQMEQLPAGARNIFERSDRQYYESEKRSGERVDVLLSLFAVNYPADFARK